MDIGSAIAVFLVLSLILLALFCFLTRFFHHKLQQKIQETAEIYSMVDQINDVYSENENDMEPTYAKSGSKQKYLARTSKKKKNDEDEMVVEMSDLRQPINQKTDIYRPGILNSKLNDEYYNDQQETGRSMASLKRFSPDKLNTNRSNVSGGNGKQTNRLGERTNRSNQSSDITKHTYVNKLICYDCHGLNIIDVTLNSIRKLRDGVIKEKKKNTIDTIPNSDGQFSDQLQIHGFEEGDFKCYKYETTLEIENMRYNEEYSIKSLKSTVVKEAVEIEEFIRYKLQWKLL